MLVRNRHGVTVTVNEMKSVKTLRGVAYIKRDIEKTEELKSDVTVEENHTHFCKTNVGRTDEHRWRKIA
jgi:hypothetical protein